MIIAILTSPESGQPVLSHKHIEVLPEGLAGDRYATGRGFYTGVVEWDAHVTLIQQEPFDALAAEHGVTIDPKELRRNLVTRGVDLPSLIGKQFRIGEHVILHGRKAWPPCPHIVKLSGKVEIFKYLSRQCGIGADVVTGGEIHVGDAILVEDHNADPVKFLRDDPQR